MHTGLVLYRAIDTNEFCEQCLDCRSHCSAVATSQADQSADAAAVSQAPTAAIAAQPTGEALEDDSGELPPHLRPAAAAPASAAHDAMAVADGPRDAGAIAVPMQAEAPPAGGDESNAVPAAEAGGVGEQPNGDADVGPSKADILSRMDEVRLALFELRWHQT